MTDQNPNTHHDDRRTTNELSMVDGSYYEIIVNGHIDQQWSSWFANLDIYHDQDGFTILSGFIVDQSALHGILTQIRDLGLPLISITSLTQAK